MTTRRNARRGGRDSGRGSETAVNGSLFDIPATTPPAATEKAEEPAERWPTLEPGQCKAFCTDGWLFYANTQNWLACIICNRHAARQPVAPTEPPRSSEAPTVHTDHYGHEFSAVKDYAGWTRVEQAPPEEPKTRPAAPDSFTEHAPSAHGSVTSGEAARSLSAATLRNQAERVEAFIKERREYGATREEIADGLGMDLQSVNPRCVTLYKQGWIGSNPGHTRPTKKNKPAEVLLWQTWVERWKDTQRRPATREPMK